MNMTPFFELNKLNKRKKLLEIKSTMIGEEIDQLNKSIQEKLIQLNILPPTLGKNIPRLTAAQRVYKFLDENGESKAIEISKSSNMFYSYVSYILNKHSNLFLQNSENKKWNIIKKNNPQTIESAT